MTDSSPRVDDAKPIRILLLEDSDLDAELAAAHIERTGLAYTIERVVTRPDFEAAARAECHDLILADFQLPTFDGFAALELARQHCPGIPFVFLSGMLGEDIAVDALKRGATDYVTKQRLDRLPGVILRALAEGRAVAERRRAEKALRELNETLEQRVDERTRELAAANAELQREIGEREKVELALRKSQRLEAIGQLTSGVAHDFNNLLTVILGNVGFLERGAVEPATKRRLDLMRSAAERGATLTAQLLAFSRRQKLEPKPVDLNETVVSMRDLLQSSMGGSIRIETVLHEKLWPALVDPTQIELVILNLAINARDAMEVGGTLAVETANVQLGRPRAAEEPPPGDYVMISVSDTGTGMSEDVLARAFEPFFTTKDIGKGSGLGLAQVYGFARQSSGGVRIDTRIGEGTSVKIFLPRAAQPVPARGLAEHGVTAHLPRRTDGLGPRVLVVDDDTQVREITASLLSELGCEVVEAGSGTAALAAIDADREGSIVLMVIDFAMPGMNGAEAAREAKSRRPDLPVLFVTGYADKAGLLLAGDALDDWIVQKPFRRDELQLKVQAALGLGEPAGKVVSLHARRPS